MEQDLGNGFYTYYTPSVPMVTMGCMTPFGVFAYDMYAEEWLDFISKSKKLTESMLTPMPSAFKEYE